MKASLLFQEFIEVVIVAIKRSDLEHRRVSVFDA